MQNEWTGEDFEKIAYLSDKLVASDETELAETILRCIPGFFRDNYPTNLYELKKAIKAKRFTNSDYAFNEGDEVDLKKDYVSNVLALARGKAIYERLLKANANGVIPHLIDFGPGDYWMALGLGRMNLKFTYHPIGLHNNAMISAKEELEALWCTRPVKDRENWFIAYEIIEHLNYVDEIRDHYDRIEGNVTKVFLSTPMYCFGEGNPEWRIRGIPHLRTYTPKEFYEVSCKLFREFKFEFIPDPVMVLIGSKEGI